MMASLLNTILQSNVVTTTHTLVGLITTNRLLQTLLVVIFGLFAVVLHISIIWVISFIILTMLILSHLKVRLIGHKPSKVRVKSLHVFPIKSCGGVDVQETIVTARGLKFDREYAICSRVESFNKVYRGDPQYINGQKDRPFQTVTAREIPKLFQIKPCIPEEGKGIKIEFEGDNGRHPSLYVPLLTANNGGAKVTATLWGSEVTGIDQGEIIAQAITNFIRNKDNCKTAADGDCKKIPDLRLVHFVARENKPSEKSPIGYYPAPRWADGMPMLIAHEGTPKSITNWSAIEDWKTTASRFRFNVLFEDRESEPSGIYNTKGFLEDQWTKMEWKNTECGNGFVVVDMLKPCPRCPMPTYNPHTSARDGLKVHGFTKRDLKRTGQLMKLLNPGVWKEFLQDVKLKDSFFVGMNASLGVNEPNVHLKVGDEVRCIY